MVFGTKSSFGASLNVDGLNGSNGFKISGPVAGYGTGFSVSAGDVNGDGFEDLIVGAPFPYASPYATAPGVSYVVFGKESGFSSNFDVSSIDGSNGFQISGAVARGLSGRSVASAGDVNSDGFDDLIVGAPNVVPDGGSASYGAAYVVFGAASGFPANLELSSLDGTNGFEISGGPASGSMGFSVASAGDVNADGRDDVIVGATGVGASYVVFGNTTGFSADFDVATLDGINGFEITDTDGGYGYATGHSVASAGDVNGDGFDDVIVGAPGAQPNGTYSGASYVVFGSGASFFANIDVSTLDGTNGFQISGESGGDAGQSGWSVASAGDVNGDGLDDLTVGAPYANNAAGLSYVIYGLKPDSAVERIGTVADQSLVGGDFDDVLKGRAGDDALWGHGGKDEIKGGHDDDMIFGGGGKDELKGGKGSDVVFGGSGKDELSGEGGDDTFVFTDLGKRNADKIRDFKPSSDMIGLDQGVFTVLVGTLEKSQFEEGKKAGGGDDHIIYDKQSGKLFYDSDGKGGEDQVLFAKLEKVLKLTHEHFDVDLFA